MSAFTELPEINCRVFHSEEVHNNGLPATPGWYWEWNENGQWFGPFDIRLRAIADAKISMKKKA
jgi:hypothetical protein